MRLLFAALERAPAPVQAWLAQAVQLLRQSVERDDDAAEAAYWERIEDITSAIATSSPALTETYGTGKDLLRTVNVIVGAIYLVHVRGEPERAKGLGAFGPRRYAALPHLDRIREQLGMPAPSWRPAGSGAVPYFERREEFLAWLHARADEVSIGEVEQSALAKVVGLNAYSDRRDARARALRKLLEQYGVVWTAFCASRRRRFIEQLDAKVAKIERYGPQATLTAVATAFGVTAERLRRQLEENGLRDWKAYRERRGRGRS